jgi:hypothetical protein
MFIGFLQRSHPRRRNVRPYPPAATLARNRRLQRWRGDFDAKRLASLNLSA